MMQVTNPAALTSLIGSVKNGDGQNTPAVVPEFRELGATTGKRCAIAQLERIVKSTHSHRPIIQFSTQFAKRLENVVRHVRCYAMARFGWIPFAFASVAMGDPGHGADLNRMNHADALFSALSQVESGDNDRAIGPKGERTRYQILPAVWKRFGGGANPVEPVSALRVAESVMRPRVNSFIKTQGRPPSAQEWYLLWHCPARVMSPRKADLEKAERFANLVK